MSSPGAKLTTHLVSLSTPTSYSAATEHNFLATAGKGALSDARLSLYLSQDRLYAAHAYPHFIGLLLASVPFSSLHGLKSPQEHFNRRIVELLSYSLQNVVRESGFFVDTAAKYGLKLDGWKEREATRDYTAEMIRIGATGRIQDGLIFLWAMERVYLDAWKFVASELAQSSQQPSLALAALVDNWTNAEFEKFVNDLADLVDDLRIVPGSDDANRAEEIWARVLELEEAFWPGGDEEVALMSS